MRKYLRILRKVLLTLFLVCYALATLCVLGILSYDHQYHYFFFIGSLMLFLYFGTFIYDWIQDPYKSFHKKAGRY